jgi:hypothetical protein
MLTIHNTDKIVKKIVNANYVDKGIVLQRSYQIEWMNENKSYYAIKLKDSFNGLQRLIFIHREHNITGPLTKEKYYKIEDQKTKKWTLTSFSKIKDINKFLHSELKFLLEII